MGRSLDSADKSSKQLTKSVGGLRNAFTALGAGVGIAAVVAGLKSATQAALDFGSAMAEVSTLLPDNTELGALTDNARSLALEFGKSPTAEVKSFYQIISAGASNAAEATDTLTAANKLAVGGITTVNIAADGLTSILNAYEGQIGSATDVSDALFVAMKAGKTTIGELSSSLGLVAPIAASVGVEFDELVGTIAALTKGGIDTKIAVQGVRAILAAVAKATEPVRKEAKGLGIDFSVAGLQAKGFAGFMKDLVDKTDGSAEVLGRLLGGVEALVPALALAGSAGDSLSQIMIDMANKAGATEEAFIKMSDNAQFKMDKLRAAFAVLALDIGDSLLKGVVPATEALVENIDSVKNALAGAALASGAGLFLTLARAIFVAEGAVLGLNAAMRANPILAIASLIGLATFALLELRDATEETATATKTHASELARLNTLQREAKGLTEALTDANKEEAESVLDQVSARLLLIRAERESQFAEARGLESRIAALKEAIAKGTEEGVVPIQFGIQLEDLERDLAGLRDELTEVEEIEARLEALRRRISEPPTPRRRPDRPAGDGGGTGGAAGDAESRELVTDATIEFIEQLKIETSLLALEADEREKVLAVMEAQNRAMEQGNLLRPEQIQAIRDQVGAQQRLKKTNEDAAEAEGKRNELISEGEAVFDATRTSLERYLIELERLNKLNDAGALKAGVFERAVKQAGEALEDAEAKTDTFADAIDDLGLSFSSAFEDALVDGAKLSDLLNSLIEDIRRIGIRTFITEPVFGGLTDFAKGGTGGELGEQIESFFDPDASIRRQADLDIADAPEVFGGLAEAADTAATALAGASISTDAMSAAGLAGAEIIGGDLVKSTADAVIGTITETATKQTLVGALTQLTIAAESAALALSTVGASGGAGGILGIFNGGGGGGPGPLPTTFADVLHKGGVAGQSITKAIVPAAAFAGAPKFQTGGVVGFQPGEVPAKLHRGETVRTPAQEAALRSGSGVRGDTIMITVNVPPGTQNPNAFGMNVGRRVANAFEAAMLSAQRKM